MCRTAKILLVGLVSVALLGIVVSAAEITVGSGESIQKAIDGASSGDTILVKPGTYKVNLKIDKSIVLKSTGAAKETILEPENTGKDIITAEAPEGEPAITNVVINGFTIQDGGKSGIVLTGSNHRIVNNIVKNIAKHGIIPISGKQLVIARNTVKNCRKTGIFLWGTKQVVITRNELSENKIAIEFSKGATGGLVHFNNIVNSWTFAIRSKPEVNATFNWWGEGVNPSQWVAGQVTVSPVLNGPFAQGTPVFLED